MKDIMRLPVSVGGGRRIWIDVSGRLINTILRNYISIITNHYPAITQKISCKPLITCLFPLLPLLPTQNKGPYILPPLASDLESASGSAGGKFATAYLKKVGNNGNNGNNEITY